MPAAAQLTSYSATGTLHRLALLKFGSVEQVKTWLSSPEYTALAEIRTKSSDINMVVVEGL